MKNNQHIFFFLSIGLAAAVAFLFMVWVTPYGAGVTTDATVYIDTAKSLLLGRGFRIEGAPVTHFPPLYPLFLAAVGFLENDPVKAARLLNAALFSVNTTLIALVVYWTTGRRFWIGFLSMTFFLASAPLLRLHFMAWSEPLFITFLLVSILLLSLYLQRPTASLLAASALLLGCAVLIRYIGAAFLPAAALIIFAGTAGQPLITRIRRALGWSILAIAPPVIWFIRNDIAAGSLTNRSLVPHPIPAGKYVMDIFSSLFDFFLPLPLPPGAEAAIFGLLMLLITALLVRHRKRRPTPVRWQSMSVLVPAACFLFSLSYMLFLYLSISFVDASTPVDSRLLSPVLALAIPGVFAGMSGLARLLKQPKLWVLFLLLIAVSIPMKIPNAIQAAQRSRTEGLGYTSKLWRQSESLAFVKQLVGDVTIYTNGAEVIRFYTKKPARLPPRKESPYSLEANPAFPEEIGRMCTDLSENNAVFVHFTRITERLYLPTQAEFEAACPVPILQQFQDGTVYGKKK